jgi:hypothetical protein
MFCYNAPHGREQHRNPSQQRGYSYGSPRNDPLLPSFYFHKPNPQSIDCISSLVEDLHASSMPIVGRLLSANSGVLPRLSARWFAKCECALQDFRNLPKNWLR